MVQLGHGSQARFWRLIRVALFGMIGLGTSWPVQATKVGKCLRIAKRTLFRRPSGKICLLNGMGVSAVVIALLSGVSSAQAQNPDCLRIAVQEATRGRLSVAAYLNAMEAQNLCVNLVWLPNQRIAIAMDNGDVDGVFARLSDFDKAVQVEIVRGDAVLSRVPAFLITKDQRVHQIADLGHQPLGVWLGARWFDKLVGSYPNLYRIPGGGRMMRQMLVNGHIAAALMDGYSLRISGGLPAGFHALEIGKLDVYSWLRAEQKDKLARFNMATKAFLEAVKRGQ